MLVFCFSIIWFSSRLTSSSLFLLGSVFYAFLEFYRDGLALMRIFEFSLEVMDWFFLSAWTTEIDWGDSLDRLLSSSLGSIFPCLTFSIFSIISRFCFSISFFMICRCSRSCSLSRWICYAFVIFSSILFISFSFSYSCTFIMR